MREKNIPVIPVWRERRESQGLLGWCFLHTWPMYLQQFCGLGKMLIKHLAAEVAKCN